MRNFLRNFPFFEPPFGDVTYGIIFVLIIFAFGFITGGDTLIYIAIALSFGFVMLAGLALQYLWQEKRTGVLWYVYTLILIAVCLGYIPEIFKDYESNIINWSNLVLFLGSILTPMFAVMVLLDKYYFSKSFWKLIFASEFIVLPLLLHKSVSDIEMVTGSGIQTEEILFGSIMYFLFMSPYLIALYRHSFK